MKTLQQKLNSLPAMRRKKITEHSDVMVAEEKAMREMRKEHPSSASPTGAITREV